MDVLHTAIWVSDLEATSEFYEDVLGLDHSKKLVGDDGVTNYFVTGESDAEIQFKYDADADVDVDVDPGTMDHLAVAVEDVDAAAERAVEEWESEVVDGPRDVAELDLRVAFVTDPDGYTVELIQER